MSRLRRAIILAGGRGIRLRPYTTVLPKPLMPIGEYPILELVVRQLAKSGFRHLTLAVNHQAELIRAYFNDGSKWNVIIDYSQENEVLGTMGPLKLLKDLPDNFLVMNGDILTDLNFQAFYEDHVSDRRLFTIAAAVRSELIDYGVLTVNHKNILTNFDEKPIREQIVSMGIYVANAEILQFIPNSAYGFDNLMRELLRRAKPVNVYKYSGYWMDIGRPDDYEKALEEFETMKEKFLGIS